MKNQFVYTRLEKVQKPEVNGEKQPEEFARRLDSLNIDKIIRTLARADGSRLVVLDDFHEEMRPVPIRNKSGKVTGAKNEKNTYQSEIVLLPEDAERLMNLVKTDD